MENPNSETNDWDWELIPNSDEHNHSTDSPSFGDRCGGGGVIRSDHFSLEGGELDNPSWVDHVNQGFSDHFTKSSEIVQNSGINDVDNFNSVTGFSDNLAESSEIVRNSGNNGVEITNSVTGTSDQVANSSGIAQNSGNNDVEIISFAKSSEIVQNSEVEISLLTGFSDNFAKSLGVVQNSGTNDVGIDSVTGFSDNFAKSLGIVQNSGTNDVGIDSLTGFSDNFAKSSETVDQNSGNEDVEINSVTGFSDHSSKSSEIVYQNSGNDDTESFSGEPAEEQEQENHGNCLNFEDDEEKKMEGNENEKRVVWWKVPLEVLKYCVLRVSPVWSLSMAAAALMGFVLLRRRYLYKMKRKSMSVQVNVTVHDKKVSQLMSQAARLNEAFSVVKRVPIIRLPAPGMASWPVMSLR